MGIFSSIFGAKALKKANRNAMIAQEEGMKDAMSYYAPFDDASKTGLAAYLDAIGQGDSQRAIDTFKASPMYRLNYDEMLRAGETGVNSMGQATGTARSGRTLMALQDNAQRVNNGLFSSYVNPLAGLSDAGVGIAGSKAQIRTQGADNQAQGIMNKGHIKAGQMAGFDGLLNGAISLAGGFGGFGAGSIGQGLGERFGFAKSLY
jgi:hypothetical protein